MNSGDTSVDTNSDTWRLFNPVFCAVLLNKACAAYKKKSSSPMPVTFAFLILPNALHKPTREALPKTTHTSMWGWLQDNPVLLMDFVERVKAIRPYTGSAIAFGLKNSMLFEAPGTIEPGKLRRRPRTLNATEDWESCVKTAEFLGRWFAGASFDEATILAIWGVRP